MLIFRDVTAQRRARTRQGKSADDGSPARVDRRILRRRHHQQVAGRHHSNLERRRRASLRLLGREAIGRHISLVIPPERIAEEDQIVASLKAGRRIEHFETERIGPTAVESSCL